MEKYSGIHDDHRSVREQTHSQRVNILYYCTTATESATDNIFFLKYLNTRTKIFKYSNGSALKYSDNSIRNSNRNSNILILYSHEVHADSKFGQTYYTI